MFCIVGIATTARPAYDTGRNPIANNRISNTTTATLSELFIFTIVNKTPYLAGIIGALFIIFYSGEDTLIYNTFFLLQNDFIHFIGFNSIENIPFGSAPHTTKLLNTQHILVYNSKQHYVMCLFRLGGAECG